MKQEEVVVLSVEDATAHARALGIRLQFETVDGTKGCAWPDGAVDLLKKTLEEKQAASAVHRVGCSCNVCAQHGMAERERESRLPVKKGTHDWKAQPRIYVEREGDDPHVFGHLLTLGGLTLLTGLMLGFCVLGGIVVGRVIHDAAVSGSWSKTLHSISLRLGPA